MLPRTHRSLPKTFVLLFACGALALAGAFLLLPADDAVAIEGCKNPSCGPTQYTPVVLGYSTMDCLWAEYDAAEKTQQHITCGADGECVNEFEVTQQCALVNGLWQVYGRTRYRCAICS